MMKKSYIQPQIEMIAFEVQTIMMDSSWIDVGGESDVFDTNERRGSWGNRWE